MASVITCVTHNANGLENNQKRRELFHYFHLKWYDLCFVQEMHSTKQCKKQWTAKWGGKIWFAHGDTKSKGVAIWTSKNLDLMVHNVIRDNDGRYIMLYATWQNFKTLLVNIYAPNKDSPNFFHEVTRNISRFTYDHILIAGDFNFALNPNIDRSGSLINNEKAVEVWVKFMQTQGLTDIWRHLHPDEKGFTWRRLRPRPTFSRLDYVFTNQVLKQFVDKLDIVPGFKSDHSTLKLTLKINFLKKGPGYWKLNTSLLRDADYVQKMNNLLDIELNQSQESFWNKWQLTKLLVRGSSIQYSARKQKAKRNKVEVLELKLKCLESELVNKDITGLFQDTEEQIRQVKHELNILHGEKTKGAMLRCKANWSLKGECPTQYFL